MEQGTLQNHIQLPFSTSHAFIIGINDYKHVSRLSTAVNDASALAEKLENLHGYQVHRPLLNATKADIMRLLHDDLPKLVGTDDRVLFYFAGHGIALDGDEGPNGYLVAADTQPGVKETLISMNDLHDALTSLPCRHGLLILDCCFSGAFKWSSGFRDVIFDLPQIIYEERFWRYCKDPAWQVITSSAYDQKAVDIITNQSLGLRESSGKAHSPFAAALFNALNGDADIIPAGKGDGVITATELYTYLRDLVETETTEKVKRQSPSLFNLQRHDKGEFIFLSPNHRFNLPPTPDRNPFMGLSSFNEEDATLFYGRDRVIIELLEKIKQRSLIVVSGASGTGKSSVIKAGVIPQLRKQGYHILPIIRPGKEPMKTLETELPGLENQLTNNKTVLVIDQYEELITQCLHPDERNAFEAQIADWLVRYPDLRILLSIRSDFEPQFESEVLEKWWLPGRYIVPSFSLEEIREVITKPAVQSVLFYEPEELIDQLGEEVSQAPGALPLLSFTLSELYHAYLKSGREDRALKEEDYNQLGGVIGALRTRADAEYESLDVAGKSTMRKLMMRMVSLEGGELAGKRVYVEELIFSDDAETKQMQTIADQLVAARLILKGKDAQGRVYVEPAHDALVRAWARLWEWIKTVGEEKISLQYKLSQAVNDYNGLLANDAKKASNLLWNNNPRLDLLNAELGGKDHGLNAREETFVRKSVQRRTRQKRINWSIAIAVMIGLAGALTYALFQNNERLKQLVISEASRLGAEAKASLQGEYHATGLTQAMEGYGKRGTQSDLTVQRTLVEVFDNFRKHPLLFPTHKLALTAPLPTSGGLVVSPSEKILVTLTEDSTVTFWNMNQYQPIHQVKLKSNSQLKGFSPDEKNFMISQGSGVINIVNIGTGTLNIISAKMKNVDSDLSVVFANNESLLLYYENTTFGPTGVITKVIAEWQDLKGNPLKRKTFANGYIYPEIGKIISKDEGAITIFDFDGNQIDKIYEVQNSEWKFSADGSKILFILSDNLAVLRDISKKYSVRLEGSNWYEFNDKGNNIIGEDIEGNLRIFDYAGRSSFIPINPREEYDNWEEFGPAQGQFYFSSDGSKFAYFRSRSNAEEKESALDEDYYWEGPWIYNIQNGKVEQFIGEPKRMILNAEFFANNALWVSSYGYKYDISENSIIHNIFIKDKEAIELKEDAMDFKRDCGLVISASGDLYNENGSLIMRLNEKYDDYQELNFLQKSYTLLSVANADKDTLTIWGNLFSNNSQSKTPSVCTTNYSSHLFDSKSGTLETTPSDQGDQGTMVRLDNQLRLNTNTGFLYNEKNQIVDSIHQSDGRNPTFWTDAELSNANQYKEKRTVRVIGNLVYFELLTSTSMTVPNIFREGSLWDTDSKQYLFDQRGPSSFAKTEKSRNVLLLANGNSLEYWDATNKVMAASFNHRNPVMAGALSKDGTLVLSGDDAGLVRLWTIDGSLLSEVNIPGLKSLAFLEGENGYLAKTGNGQEIFLTPQGIHQNFKNFVNTEVIAATNLKEMQVVNDPPPPTSNKQETQTTNAPPKKEEQMPPAKVETPPSIDHEQIIRDFLQAEDRRDIDKIKSFYARSVSRYWDLTNPSWSEISRKYEGSWNIIAEAKNKVVQIEQVNGNTFTYDTDFTFRKKSDQQSTTKRSKILITFNDAGKIEAIYRGETESTTSVASPRVFGRLTGDNVNVRKTPVNGSSIMKLSTGDQVEILEEKTPNGETIPWYLIKYNNKQGWIRSDFIRK